MAGEGSTGPSRSHGDPHEARQRVTQLVEPERCGLVGQEVLNEDIGFGREFGDHRPICVAREVSDHGPSIAVGGQEVGGGIADEGGAELADRISGLALLHLDHVSTEVTEDLTGEGASEDPRAIEHLDPREGKVLVGGMISGPRHP